MGVKMTSRVTKKKFKLVKKKDFPQNRVYSRFDSGVPTDSVGLKSKPEVFVDGVAVVQP